MKTIVFALFCCLVAAGTVAPPLSAAPPRPGDMNDLNLEVTALLTLSHLDLNEDQLKGLAALAKGAAQKPGKRQPAKVSSKYRAALINLHAALATGDDAKINEAKEKLDDQMDDKDTDLDEEYPITDTARQQAAKALLLLNARQLGTYIGSLNLTDPVERLVDGLDELRDVEGADDKKQVAEAIAVEVGRLAGGFDTERARSIQEKVAALLTEATNLKDGDFKKQKPDLEKQARRLLRDVNPLEVLGHVAENALAELLANPRLEAALRIQVQRPKEKEKD
jgi:hypothetical protein